MTRPTKADRVVRLHRLRAGVARDGVLSARRRADIPERQLVPRAQRIRRSDRGGGRSGRDVSGRAGAARRSSGSTGGAGREAHRHGGTSPRRFTRAGVPVGFACGGRCAPRRRLVAASIAARGAAGLDPADRVRRAAGVCPSWDRSDRSGRAGGRAAGRSHGGLRRRRGPAGRRTDAGAATRDDRDYSGSHRRCHGRRSDCGAGGRPSVRVGGGGPDGAVGTGRRVYPDWVTFFDYTNWATGSSTKVSTAIQIRISDIFTRISGARSGCSSRGSPRSSRHCSRRARSRSGRAMCLRSIPTA